MSSNLAVEQPSGRLRPIFTVGHSSQDFSQFLRLLHKHGIETLIDVRSRPQSARFPDFSQPRLEKLLESERIRYLFLGEELGGRPDDPDAYLPEGVVDYASGRKSYAFRQGLERALGEAETHVVGLMCAEEDPLECHRSLMICPELVSLGIRPLHIRKNSLLETQERAENRLLGSVGLGAFAENTLFPEDRLNSLEKAYALQAKKFAFHIDPQPVDRG